MQKQGFIGPYEFPACIRGDFTWRYLAQTSRSVVYLGTRGETQGPQYVIKVLKEGMTGGAARETARTFRGHHRFLEGYLAPYLIETQVILNQRRDGWQEVVSLQPYLAGQSFIQGLRLIQAGQRDGTEVVDFLTRALGIYRSTGRLPDIFGDIFADVLQPVYERFYPYDNRNVILQDDGEQLHPCLIDTILARKSLKPWTGRVYTALFALKTATVLYGLRQQQGMPLPGWVCAPVGRPGKGLDQGWSITRKVGVARPTARVGQ
jgi:hypothetical protein